MSKIKGKIGKLLILLCACLSIGAVANAAGSATTDVEIAIEASGTEMSDENTTEHKQEPKTVKTGDKAGWIKYLVAFGVAAAVIIGFIRKKKKGLLAMVALFLSVFFINDSALAAEASENVSVTIPTSITISFSETGENEISPFEVKNQSLVPITIEKINATECNDWKLSETGQKIPVNTKEIVFEIEKQCLENGENAVSIPVAEDTNKVLEINVERGAWTVSNTAEKALELEFEYAIGKKEFKLTFDTNGCSETVAAQNVCNGDVVQLPVIEREGYVLAGWEDAEGKLYTDQYVMQIGDVTLKARWKEEIAYAIYSASDTSLRFVRSADSITAGSTYNGRVVTDVFTGFEDAVYTSEYEVPWYDGNYYDQRVITKIIFEDTIKPKSTAYWFNWAYDCDYVDVRKLDMSQVTDMQYMLGWCGSDAQTFKILGINDWNVSNVTNMEFALAFIGFNEKTVVLDLSKWDVSKVTNMWGAFKGIGYYSTTFSLGDLSRWNVSNVTTMREMFMQTGYSATWYLDCSKWNVSKVTNYYRFNIRVESKVIEPKWVN